MDAGFKGFLAPGVFAGVVWGWIAMAINSLTGVFPYEASLATNLASFSFAGALFGIMTSGCLYMFGRFIPFKGILPKAMIASAGLWIFLWGFSMLLVALESGRYHFAASQAVQGLVLSFVMGALLSLLVRKGSEA